MSKSKESLQLLLSNWEKLKEARPDESSFAPHGWPGIGYDSLDRIFDGWSTVIEALEARGAWATSPEAALADKPISALIGELNGFVAGAEKQGISWLIGQGFLTRLTEGQNLINSLIAKRLSVSRAVGRELSERGIGGLETVIKAESAANAVMALEEASKAGAVATAGSAEAAKIAEEQAKESHAEVARIAGEVSSSAVAVEEARVAVEGALKSIATLKEAASEREAALQARVLALDATISATQEQAETALESVKEALRRVRDQGLAQAFQARSNKLRNERRLWTALFVGSIFVLALVSVSLVLELTELTYEALIVSLLRKAALAGPAIWLGWYSAKQVGRVARVQEDYEYKAASALAFQSYKEEAVLGGDPALISQLLKNAINTFGENPVRLYEEIHKDSVTPLGAAFKDQSPEVIAAAKALLAVSPKRPAS